MGNRLLLALIAIIGVPAVTIGYIALADWVVERLPIRVRPRIRPWLWMAPVLIILAVFLIYPALYTLYLSFFNADTTRVVGLRNYATFFTSPSTLITLRNNVYWLVFSTGLTVLFGLVFAVLFDRVRYETAAKAIVFIPMAISFVAASIIWKLMYDYQPASVPQTGALNAILVAFGGQPQAWLVNRSTNNPALIWVGIWMWTGFALVILSAGLKSVPGDLLEAARVDGANEFQIFRWITIPMLGSTIAVVATTMVINALKAFDIVYVMTSGNFGTDVMANRMFTEMFVDINFGLASAVAVILLIAIIPVMLVNIRRFREQEAMR